MSDHMTARGEGVASGPSTRYLRRKEAAEYLLKTYGFGAVRTLAKGVVTGDSPAYHKAGRMVLYTLPALDIWAKAKIGGARRSSSDGKAA